ncbi:tRNA G18 (ribose-2'-O)-methylase SpoU [Micrococcales bacterium KH10]|nr:tRNA G18 (ribose-2'-O)-methylase SpoU [Micrococcales bacterium KH10]
MGGCSVSTKWCRFNPASTATSHRSPWWQQRNNRADRHNRSVTIIELTSLSDPDGPDLSDYTGLTDVELRKRVEPAQGMYLAESSNVIRRALAAGHRVRSMLMAPRWLDSLADVLCDLDPSIPIYVAAEELLQELTGFHLHRGAIAAMYRPALDDPATLLANLTATQDVTRVAIFEDMVDHTNLGAAFRAAAGLCVDAVFITPSCADPLYRRSVRVSMGAVFQVPWTRFQAWPHPRKIRQRRTRLANAPYSAAEDSAVIAEPGGIQLLREYGFTTAALALDESSVDLGDFERDLPDRLALVFGTEGNGLRPSTIAACDVTVRIPMAAEVDSLNVAAAAAVAFWATRKR